MRENEPFATYVQKWQELKMNKQYDRNLRIRLIYEGLGFIVSVIDYLNFEYMYVWRNQMMRWKVELERRYNWLGKG